MGGYAIFDIRPTFRRLFEILEIDTERLIQIKHPTQFENIIVPDDSFLSTGDTCFFTEEYREMMERVRNFALKNQTPSSAKKIYYFYGRNQIGEERLAEYFKSKGYEVIQPEKLSLDEQLNVLINAESFASTVVSCAHNSIFLREGTEVILIPRVANRINLYQLALDQISKVNENYVDSSLSVFETLLGPYCFIISEQLKKFFGDEFDGYSEEDFRTFLTYARVSANAGLKENAKALPHYAPIMQKFYPQLKARGDLLKEFGIVLP